MTEFEAENAVMKMNQLFARRDANYAREHPDVDLCRKLDSSGQAIKSNLMQSGWRLGLAGRKFRLIENVGPMVVVEIKA